MRADGRRVAGAALLLGAALSALIAWGGSSLTTRADFAFCNQAEVSSLDPAVITGVPEARIVQALFEGLTRQDPVTGQPLPGMARAWSVSPDGLTWRFTLRDDSLWTDGSRVTAHDFEYSLRRLLAPATASPSAYLLWCLQGGAEASRAAPAAMPGTAAEAPALEAADAVLAHAAASGAGPEPGPPLGIEATSETELVLRLERPCPALPGILALAGLCPVNRACVERWGPAWIAPEHIVSNGPFRLVERRVRDRIRLERFDGYWGREEVGLGSIDAYAADGNTTQVNLYLTGVTDWMVRPPSGLYDALLPRPDCRRGPQCGLTFLRFNHERAPFDDPRVRLALFLALDRESLARDVLRGGERAADTFVPPGMPGYEPARWPARDPDRARALLAEAGFPGGAGFPDFELLHPQNQIARDLCETLAAQWRTELGLPCRLAGQPWKVFLDSQNHLRYDVSWSAWIADWLDPETFVEVFLTDGGNNRSGFSDAAYDGLVARAAREPDPAARAALLRAAEQRLVDLCALAPLHHRVNVNLVALRVRGFHDNPLDVHPLRDLSVPAAPP